MINFPKDPKQLRKFNLIRYNETPPSWELIERVVKKSKIKRMYLFEAVWGIPKGSLTLYKTGERILPVKYWHIFYDFELVNQIYSKLEKKNKSLLNNITI